MHIARPLGAGALAGLLVLAACQGPRLTARLGLPGAQTPTAADRRSPPASGRGLLQVRGPRGERTTTYVETIDLTPEELEILRRDRALREPSNRARRGPPTLAEALMEAARGTQGSNDPLKQKVPGGICIPVAK